MGTRNRYQGIDAYASRLIRYKAKRLVGRFGFTAADREDLEQELMFDLHRRLPKYDARRARRDTFIDRIVNHKIATIIESRIAGKRDYRLLAPLPDDYDIEFDEEGEPIDRKDPLDQDNYMFRIGRRYRPEAERHDLQLDVRKCVERLDSGLRRLCLRLMTETITETSRSSGIPRGTLYDAIEKLRVIFEEAGLTDYL
jgi:RNA polymerase sigma-70 factor (ECF subfamily)